LGENLLTEIEILCCSAETSFCIFTIIVTFSPCPQEWKNNFNSVFLSFIVLYFSLLLICSSDIKILYLIAIDNLSTNKQLGEHQSYPGYMLMITNVVIHLFLVTVK